MRKYLLILILTTALSGCGGSGSSTLNGLSGQGNFISTTVELEQRFVYALNTDSGTVSAFAVESAEAEGEHAHAHAKVLAQHDHEHGTEEEGTGLRELDSSPYSFPGNPPVGLAVGGDGRNLYLVDAQGSLSVNLIDGVTGLLTPGQSVATGISNPRLLRVSDSGDALAVLGDDLAIFALDDDGALSIGALVPNTQDWTDVRLQGDTGAAATASGAAGFRWSPGTTSTTFEIVLPGATRGQLALAAEGVFVVNREDRSLSQLSLGNNGALTLLQTFGLPQDLLDPQTIASLFDGEDLVVGDDDSVALLHPDEAGLEQEGIVDIDEVPTVLFPLPETTLVLAGHAQGVGFHVLEVSEEGMTVLQETSPEQAGVSAFGQAFRVEQVTAIINP